MPLSQPLAKSPCHIPLEENNRKATAVWLWEPTTSPGLKMAMPPFGAVFIVHFRWKKGNIIHLRERRKAFFMASWFKRGGGGREGGCIWAALRSGRWEIMLDRWTGGQSPGQVIKGAPQISLLTYIPPPCIWLHRCVYINWDFPGCLKASILMGIGFQIS